MNSWKGRDYLGLGRSGYRVHSIRTVRRVYAPRFFVLSQQRFGVTDIQALWGVTALRSRADRIIALRQISVTALFYLEDSRKIHLRGVRARRSKDAKRRAPHHAGERESARRRGGKRALWVLFMFFLPPGPVLCKLGLGRSSVLPEVLAPVLGPPFDLLLFCFRGRFPSLSFSHRHFELLFPVLTT